MRTSLLSQNEDAITNPDVMPEFPGGTTAMMKFISSHITYPEVDKRENKGAFSCKSIVEFTIDKNGIMKNIFIVRSCVGCNACDAEAVKIFEKMPHWKAGLLKNKPIAVKMGMPVFFNFQ